MVLRYESVYWPQRIYHFYMTWNNEYHEDLRIRVGNHIAMAPLAVYFRAAIATLAMTTGISLFSSFKGKYPMEWFKTFQPLQVPFIWIGNRSVLRLKDLKILLRMRERQLNPIMWSHSCLLSCHQLICLMRQLLDSSVSAAQLVSLS